MPKDKAAQSLARKRWANKTAEERQATAKHAAKARTPEQMQEQARRMREAKARKRAEK